jgi:hypothetical protein
MTAKSKASTVLGCSEIGFEDSNPAQSVDVSPRLSLLSLDGRGIFDRVAKEEVLIKVKVKLSLCFNPASGHEGVLGEWRYSYTHFLPRH